MPKTRRSGGRHKKGGNTMDSVSQTGSNVINTMSNTADQAGTGIQNFFTNGYNKIFKKQQSTYGGRRSRRKRGGYYRASTSQMNVASGAAPVSGIKTAQPHHWVGKDQKWVGGKRTKRRRTRRRTRKY